jgi:hypothetical protein
MVQKGIGEQAWLSKIGRAHAKSRIKETDTDRSTWCYSSWRMGTPLEP